MLWYHLVRRSSYCWGQRSSGKWRAIVPGTPGMWGILPQGKAGENGQPGSCLCKSGLQETVGYAGGKLPAGVANDWVTCRSPVSVIGLLRGEQHHAVAPRFVSATIFISHTERLLACADWWLNVQSGLHDPGNNTLGILQSA